VSAIIRTLIVSSLTLFCVACGGSADGGAAPVSTTPPTPPTQPPPPPVAFACTGVDTFPGFLYATERTATSPEETRLASSDGCRTESLGVARHLSMNMHMTADRSKGVLVWTADSDKGEEQIVRRLDFTVDASGNLDVGQPVTILPLAGEESLPGDDISDFVSDVWGDATHDSLYITVMRIENFNSGPNAGTGTRVVSIYDLNTLTNVNDSPDVRTIFDQYIPSNEAPESFSWLDAGDPSTLPDCFEVPYPQFVPTCYRTDWSMRFNPSGTRLYLDHGLHRDLQDTGVYWGSTMRINIDKTADPTLGNWLLAGPELVYAMDHGVTGELNGPYPRPEADPLQLPSPEYVAVSLGDGSDNPTSEVTMLLNADQCAAVYAPYANGTLEAPSNLWQQCKDESTLSYDGTMPGGPYSWQSPEALLRGTFQGRETELFDVHRIYLSGALAGTVQQESRDDGVLITFLYRHREIIDHT